MPFALVLLLLPLMAFSRWANKSDFAYLTEDFRTVIEVRKDGTYTQTDELTYVILKEAGKNKFTLHRIPYSSGSTSVKIQEARVMNGPVTTTVTHDKIVERTAVNNVGFDDRKEIQIAFPNLQIGSQIKLKMVSEVKKVAVPGHFSLMMLLGKDGPNERGSVLIKSELPLGLVSHDPYHSLEIQERKENELHLYEVKLKVPYLHELAEEYASLPPDKMTYVSLSTDKEWSAISTNMLARFDSVLGDKLPKELEAVVAEAAKVTTLDSRVNALVTYIVQNYNYLGDWRNLSGAFTPRKPEQIVSTKYGDCKDFATLFVMMARKLSIDASIVLVHRSTPNQGPLLEKMLPTLEIFNHAIARVRFGDKTYWVDPTNPVSFGLMHREDIANKPALTLDGKNTVETIPFLSEKQNFLELEKSLTLKKDGSVAVEGKMRSFGEIPVVIQTVAATKDKETAGKVLEAFLSQGEEPILPEYKNLELGSKSYRGLDFSFSYTGKKLTRKNGKEHQLLMPNFYLYLLKVLPDFSLWQGGLTLGHRFTLKRTTTMNNFFLSAPPVSCKVQSKWFRLSKTYEMGAYGFKQSDFLEVLVSEIPNAELRSKDFKQTIKRMSECSQKSSFSYLPEAKAHVDHVAEMESKFSRLAVSERVQKRYEFVEKVITNQIKEKIPMSEVAKLLRLNISEDPKHSMSYFLLLRNILFSKAFSPEAIELAMPVVSKGIKEAPSQGLYIIYLRLLQLTGKVDQMKALLPKVVAMGELKEMREFTILADIYLDLKQRKEAWEILEAGASRMKIDYDKFMIHQKLGDLSYQEKKFDLCIDHFTKVAHIEPQDSLLHDTLSVCYLEKEMYEEAIKAAMDTHDGYHDPCFAISKAYVARGKQHLNHYRLDEAEADYRRAMEYAKDRNVFIGLASVSKARGDRDKMMNIIDEGAKVNQAYAADFFANAAKAFSDDRELYVELIRRYIGATDSNPNKLWGYHRIASRLFELNKKSELKTELEKAIPIGEKLVEAMPEDKFANYTLGSILTLYGISEENKDFITRGTEQLKKARQLDPGNDRINKELVAADQALTKIRSGRLPASVSEATKKQ